MTIKSKLALSAGLAAMFLISPASGAAFGSEGSVTVTLDTTGYVDSGEVCTPSTTVSFGVTPTTTMTPYVYKPNGDGTPLTFFEFESDSFEVIWSPDTCGLSSGSLVLTDFTTQAFNSDGSLYGSLMSGLQFNGMPSRHESGVYNEATGYFHSTDSDSTVASTGAALEETISIVSITETMGVYAEALPDFVYSTTATLSVLSDN